MDASLEKKLCGYKKIALEKFNEIFIAIGGGKKDIVIEADLIKPLEHICGATWLRSKGIDKIYKLDPRNPPNKRNQLIYFISSDLVTFKYVLDQINNILANTTLSQDTGFKDFHVICFPNVLFSFHHLLEEEALFGLVELYRFQWDFIALDRNVLSLELGPNFFKEVFIKHDTSLINSIATSFRLFNLVNKRPNLILAYGQQSEMVLSMVNRMENFRKQSLKDESADVPDFNTMIILDRNKDYPSCLLTPVVYSGLLLELFEHKAGYLTIDNCNNKIKSGKLELLQAPADKKIDEAAKKDCSTLMMHGPHDEIYNQNKYRHFSDVINLLGQQSKILGVEGKHFTNMNLYEIKEYVQTNLPKVTAQKKNLFKHLNICEQIVQNLGGNFEKQQNIEETIVNNKNKKQIMSYIEDVISTDPHKYNLLRLICLTDLLIGLQNDDASRFINNYCNTFGHKYMTIFQKLGSAGLFPDPLNLTVKSKLAVLTNLTPSLPKRTPLQLEVNRLKLIPMDPTFSSSKNDDESSVYASSTSLASISSTSSSPQGKISQSALKSKKDASCPSYVFNGNFIPMIAQLANVLLRAETFQEVSNKLGQIEQIKLTGKLLDNKVKTIKEISADVKKNGEAANPLSKFFPLKPRTLFIFVVGGITYGEIAACNLVEALTGSKIVLASNAIVSGQDIIKSAF